MTRSARSSKFGPFAGGAVVAPRPLIAIAATRTGGVPQNRILQIFADLMAPLQALHDEGRVHGGISNETIGLDEWGHAVLLVSALATARSADDIALHQGRASGFNAFEQYTDDPAWMVGPWTDIYALCAVGCALATGVAPQSAIDRCVRDDFVPLDRRQLKGYDADFLRALDAGLSLSPRERPRTLEAFAAKVGAPFELPELTEPDEAQLPRENIPMPTRVSVQDPMFHTYGRPGRSRVPLAVGLLAVIVSAALIFFWTRLRWTQSGNWPPTAVMAQREGARESFRPVLPGAPAGDAANIPPPPVAQTPFSVPLELAAAAPSARPPGLAEPDLSAPLPSPPGASASITSTPPPNAVASAAPPSVKPNAPVAGSRSSVPTEGPAIEVAVDVRPWGEVYVDGVSRGVSPPLRSLRLAPGRHRITLQNPGAPAYRTSIIVRAGKPVSIVHTFR